MKAAPALALLAVMAVSFVNVNGACLPTEENTDWIEGNLFSVSTGTGDTGRGICASIVALLPSAGCAAHNGDTCYVKTLATCADASKKVVLSGCYGIWKGASTLWANTEWKDSGNIAVADASSPDACKAACEANSQAVCCVHYGGACYLKAASGCIEANKINNPDRTAIWKGNVPGPSVWPNIDVHDSGSTALGDKPTLAECVAVCTSSFKCCTYHGNGCWGHTGDKCSESSKHPKEHVTTILPGGGCTNSKCS